MITSVPIPECMQHLERDCRGYPIPVIVMRDTDGRPHFTVSDEGERQRVIWLNLCSICGGALERERWLVGGPMSAFHEHGAYIDPPMHQACVNYALQVCPYLAAPNYGKRIDGKTVDPAKAGGIIVQDPLVLVERPTCFVAVATMRQELIIEGQLVRYIRALQPYTQVQYWQHGRQIDEAAACLTTAT